MRKLTEKVLLELGFKKNHVSAKESGAAPYDFFTLELKGNSCLISCESDVAKNGFYTVELFDQNGLGLCKTDEEVKILYKALMRKELKTKKQ